MTKCNTWMPSPMAWLFLLVGFSTLTLAVPVYKDDALSFRSSLLDKRLVVSPPITYPTEDTVWTTGETVNVTWDVPSYAKGYNGTILLGHLDPNDTSGSEHLWIDHPLASKFPLTDGLVTFDVPCNETIVNRTTYIVVLLGDSGNASKMFTIQRNETACAAEEENDGGKNVAPLPASGGTSGELTSGLEALVDELGASNA